MEQKNLRLTTRHRLRFTEAEASAVMPGNGNQSNALALSRQNFMKKSMLLLVALFIFTSVVLKAQSPQKINFQSIVRNTSGVIVSNKSVKFKITILADSTTGIPVYSETHLKTTDAIGLVSLQIGSGTVTSGVFSSLNWGNASHFIKLEADFTGGNTYAPLGTQELMSVPYAMYAAKTDTASLNLTNRFAEKAPVNNPSFTGTVGGITKAMVGLGNVDNTTDASKPVSSATQTALALKAPLASPAFTGTVSGIDKSMVGLGNVDNTSDASKPVSTATQTALALKAPLLSPAFTGTVSGIDKSMVGLGDVNNTSDASKPVSTATQTALALKAPLASPAFTGTVSGIDKTMVGLGNVDNTSDASKPVSSLTQSAINTKVNISDTMTMLANYKAAIDTKLNKSDFPRGNSLGEFLYWNGDRWTSLEPGQPGQSIILDQNRNPTWGCLIPSSVGTPPSPTLTVNTLMTPITIATTGVTGILAQSLPEGLEATWSANVITISGIPTQEIKWTYGIILGVSCGNPLVVQGTITVSACTPNTAGEKLDVAGLVVGSEFQKEITTTGATGIGIPTGLPEGLMATWLNNKITISGTPTESGTFIYTIPLTGGCGEVNATGTIYVNPCTPNTADSPSSNPTLSVNSPLTPITIETTGATGIDPISFGLPPGVTAAWFDHIITISGTPTTTGTFTYTILLTGGCGEVEAIGTITVTAVTVPDAPTNVVATAGDGSASVAFVAPLNNGGSVITNYFVKTDPFTIDQSDPFGRTGTTTPINVKGLANGTAYTFTVVAVNQVGPSNPSAPSNAVTPAPAASACPTPTVEDIDGNIYSTVSIGNQCWTKENLRVSRYNNGDLIPIVTDNTAWGSLTTGGRSWYSNDSTTYENPYGNLYNWYAVNDSKKLCPEGWNVPTDAEWTILTDTLGGEDVAGAKMKSMGTNYWSSESAGTDNSSGFSALPGGLREPNGSFYDIGTNANFWSATENGDSAWYRFLTTNLGYAIGVNKFKANGISVRCLLSND